jgi:hypothetical protein
MKRKTFICILLVSLLNLYFCPSLFAESDPLKNVPEITEMWLKMVDHNKYAQSWETSSPLFKSAVSKEQWASAMMQNRKPLGDVIIRTMKNLDHLKRLPGFPEGEYAVLQYSTNFASKKSALETITMRHEATGEWRTIGYFIK